MSAVLAVTPSATPGAPASDVAGVLDRNADRILRQGVVWSAGAAAVVTLTTFVGVGVVLGGLLTLVGPVAHGLLLRLGVVGVAARGARVRSRRLILRWIARAVWLLSLWGWSLATVPFWNLLALPATVAATTLTLAAYARWTLDRDQRGIAVHPAEWAVMLALLATALGALFLLLALGLALTWLLDFARGAWGGGG